MLIRNWRTFAGAFKVQLRTSLNVIDLAFPMLGQISTVIAVGWIVAQTDASSIIMAAAFGCFLTALWRSTAFQGGWILSQAHDVGALEIEMTTGASLATIVLGRLAAIAVLYAVVASITASAVLVMGGKPVHIEAPFLLFLLILAAAFSITAYAYTLIPISFLSGGMPGFFNAILPAIVIVSGFLQPTNLLPAWVKYIGMIFGTTWAMSGIRSSIQDSDSWVVCTDLLVSVVLSVLAMICARAMIVAAESRLRHGRHAAFGYR